MTRCIRCNMPRSDRLRLIHETSIWHRKYAHIQRQQRRGKSLPQIARLLGVSRVRIAKCARLAQEDEKQ